MTELIIPAIAAVFAAGLGVFLTNWYKRSKPWIGISSINRDDSSFVGIPKKVIELYDQSISYYLSPLRKKEPLYKLKDEENRMSELLEKFNETLSIINGIEQKLQRDIRTQSEKEEVLVALLKDDVFMRLLQFLNSIGKFSNIHLDDDSKNSKTKDFQYDNSTHSNSTDIQLDDDSTNNNNILRVESFYDQTRNEGGAILYGLRSRFMITVSGGITMDTLQRTSNLALIFSTFHGGKIAKILNQIKLYLNKEIEFTKSIKTSLSELITSRKLLIKVKISNLGGSPINIEPYGLLNIKPSGIKIEPIKIKVMRYKTYEPGMDELSKMMQLMEGIAENNGVEYSFNPQESTKSAEYVVINPGTLVEVDFETILPLVDHEVVSSLENGILSSQVILLTTNSKQLASSFQSMGLTISKKKTEQLNRISEVIQKNH